MINYVPYFEPPRFLQLSHPCVRGLVWFESARPFASFPVFCRGFGVCVFPAPLAFSKFHLGLLFFLPVYRFWGILFVCTQWIFRVCFARRDRIPRYRLLDLWFPTGGFSFIYSLPDGAHVMFFGIFVVFLFYVLFFMKFHAVRSFCSSLYIPMSLMLVLLIHSGVIWFRDSLVFGFLSVSVWFVPVGVHFYCSTRIGISGKFDCALSISVGCRFYYLACSLWCDCRALVAWRFLLHQGVFGRLRLLYFLNVKWQYSLLYFA